MTTVINDVSVSSDNTFYDYLTDKLKALQKQMQDGPASADNIYRVAHGDFIPVPTNTNPSDFTYEILSVQVAGDNFSSPNVGMWLTPPQHPFYKDANIIIGIVNTNQAYISNNETELSQHITGWLTIKVNKKENAA